MTSTYFELRVHLQEDGCIYRYGILCSIHTLLPTRLLILIHVKRTYHNCIYNSLPEDEPSGSKHKEDKKIKN
jgi:hypothetical protein